jgi:hypothetical protein
MLRARVIIVDARDRAICPEHQPLAHARRWPLTVHSRSTIFSRVDGRRAKELYFVRDSKKALRLMPEEVKDAFGQALLDLQFGDTPAIVKPFGEGVSAKVWKEEFQGWAGDPTIRS